MKRLLLAFALTGCLSATAQNIDAKLIKGDVFKIDNKYSELMSAAEDDAGNTIVAYRSDKGYLFQRYDAALKSTKSFDYIFKDRNILEVIVTNDKVVIVDYSYNKKAKKYVCTASTASTADFKFYAKRTFQHRRERA